MDASDGLPDADFEMDFDKQVSQKNWGWNEGRGWGGEGGGVSAPFLTRLPWEDVLFPSLLPSLSPCDW